MKKLFLLLAMAIVGVASVFAQNYDDAFCVAKYNIVGKGNSGQYSCSGTIYIMPGAPGNVVKVSENGGFAISYEVWEGKVLDGYTKVYTDRDNVYGASSRENYVDVYVQICSNNPNVRFVCLQYYNSGGVYKNVVYKTTVVKE